MILRFFGPSGSGKSTFIKIICAFNSRSRKSLDNAILDMDVLHNYFSYSQDPFILMKVF